MLFDQETILRQKANSDPNWKPPIYAGKYSARVIELLNLIAKDLVALEDKVIDLSRQPRILSPITIQLKKVLAALENRIRQSKWVSLSTDVYYNELLTTFRRYRQRDQHIFKTQGKSDFACLGENEIYHLNRRINSGMKLNRQNTVNFGPDVVGRHFCDLQNQEVNDDTILVQNWRKIDGNAFNPALCDLEIKGTDRSNSIVHIISKLKEFTTSYNSLVCRKILGGMPRLLVGKHLVQMIRLDTENGLYNKVGKTNKMIKLYKPGRDMTKLTGYRYLQIPQFSAQSTDCWFIKNMTLNFDNRKVFSDEQNGFRPHYGCDTAMTKIFENFNHSKASHSFLCYIDFKNAFGSLQHPILLQRFEQLVSAGALRLIRDQLFDRYIVVHEDGKVGTPFKIPNSGTPQGSNGGPVFFSIYAELIIDLLKKYKHCLSVVFADDLVLQITADCYDDVLKATKEIMADFIEQTAKFNIRVNEDKNEYMVLGESEDFPPIEIVVNNTKYSINHTKTTKYLGFRFNSMLSFKPHFGYLMGRIYDYRPLIFNAMKMGNIFETKGLARSLLYGVLGYGLNVLPIGTNSDYSKINRAIINIGCDILNIGFRERQKIEYNTIFHALGWMETKNLHKLSILRLFNRILMQNRPQDIADRIKSMLVYESDRKEYILPDHHRLFMRLNAEKRKIKGDGPILVFAKEDAPKDKSLFPYNVNALLQELPLHIRLQLGTDGFKSDIDRHFGGNCQHPPSKPAEKCRLCVKRKLFAEKI